MKPYLPYRPYRPYLAGAVTGEAPIVPLFQDDLTDLAIDAGGTPTRASTAYHQQPDGTWVSIASGAPRFYGARWTGSAWSLLDALGDPLPGPFGYLMEPAQINLAIQSNSFLTTWTPWQLHSAPATTLLGLGANNLIPYSALVKGHGVYNVGLPAATNGAQYTQWEYVKANGYDAVVIAIVDDEATPQNYGTAFNLATGAFHSVASANVDAYSIKDMGGGIYRIATEATGLGAANESRTAVGPAASLATGVFNPYSGDTVSGVIAGSINIFQGTIAEIGSPIVTTTAAVVRAVDALSYADPVTPNETRIVKRLVSDPETEVIVDIDDWNYSMPVPTVPTIIQSVTVYAPGERPA